MLVSVSQRFFQFRVICSVVSTWFHFLIHIWTHIFCLCFQHLIANYQFPLTDWLFGGKSTIGLIWIITLCRCSVKIDLINSIKFGSLCLFVGFSLSSKTVVVQNESFQTHFHAFPVQYLLPNTKLAPIFALKFGEVYRVFFRVFNRAPGYVFSLVSWLYLFGAP